MAEFKKVIYSGQDTDEVTKEMEAGDGKLGKKGWSPKRVDMLSSSTIQVTYVRGLEEDEDDEDEVDELS